MDRLELLPCGHAHLEQDRQEGQTICLDCGQIVSEGQVYSYQEGPITNSAIHPLSSFDVGLPSVITGQCVDFAGRKVKKRTVSQLLDSSRKAKVCSALSKNKFRGMLELERLCHLLGTPPFLEPLVKTNFIKFSDLGYLKGRNLYSCVLSILVITAAQQDVPLSMNQALKVSNVTRRKFNRDYYAIYTLYEQAPRMSAQGVAFLRRNLSYVDKGWDSYPLFQETLEQWLKVVGFQVMVGRITLVTCVTLMYYILKHHHYPGLEEYLKKTGVNKTTIQNRWSDLLALHQELKDHGIQG